jgi:prepilin-type processing-associated H-X9-DG protein/prepilin-type N-terminal cleavage/methylation domain-containing protein
MSRPTRIPCFNRASWNSGRSQPRAFTLVELLVVIGIIALLISILLPSLTAARRSAQVTACSAKLHFIMVAAQLHRQEHGDYYPLAGVLPGDTPQTLDDDYQRKYDYEPASVASNTNASQLPILAPITDALETEMVGNKYLYSNGGPMGNIDYNTNVGNFLDPKGLNAKFFLCPSHAVSPLDVLPKIEYLFYVDPHEYSCQPQSYIFNEYIVGWNDNLGYLQGKGSLLHQPALTMFAADGNGGATTTNHPGIGGLPNPMYTVYSNTTTGPVSLANAYTAPAFGVGIAGDKANFDLVRHRGRMNIAFCDGHVETRSITLAGLSNVWIVAQ